MTLLCKHTAFVWCLRTWHMVMHQKQHPFSCLFIRFKWKFHFHGSNVVTMWFPDFSNRRRQRRTPWGPRSVPDHRNKFWLPSPAFSGLEKSQIQHVDVAWKKWDYLTESFSFRAHYNSTWHQLRQKLESRVSAYVNCFQLRLSSPLLRSLDIAWQIPFYDCQQKLRAAYADRMPESYWERDAINQPTLHSSRDLNKDIFFFLCKPGEQIVMLSLIPTRSVAVREAVKKWHLSQEVVVTFMLTHSTQLHVQLQIEI